MSFNNVNYGSITTAKESFFGNVGFLTVGVNLPSNVQLPGMSVYATAKAAVKAAAFAAGGDSTAQAALAANQLIVSNAERNLFRIAQLLGQRAVISAVSDVLLDTSGKIDDVSVTVGGNILAASKAGTTSTVGTVGVPNVYFTFIIERADVFTAQASKPGSTYAISTNPALDVVNTLTTAAFFNTQDCDGTPSGDVTVGSKVSAVGAVVKVFDSLPVAR